MSSVVWSLTIPGMYDRFSQVVIVTKDAQRRGGEQQTASFNWCEPDPTHSKNAQDFTMTKEENIAAESANAANDTVRTRTHGFQRLAAGAAVEEKAPAGALHFDINSAPTLIGAVIPFHQIIVSLNPRMRHRKLGSAAGAQQRARENAIDAQCSEARPDLARLAFALLDQWKVSPAGMLCC